MASSPSALFLVVLALTVTLAAAWRYPDKVKKAYDTYTTVVIAFYTIFAFLVAVAFLSTGQTFLVIIGAFIIAAIGLRIWFDLGTKKRVRDYF